MLNWLRSLFCTTPAEAVVRITYAPLASGVKVTSLIDQDGKERYDLLSRNPWVSGVIFGLSRGDLIQMMSDCHTLLAQAERMNACRTTDSAPSQSR